MQNTLRKKKWLKLFIVTMICAVLTYFGTYSTLAATNDGDAKEESSIFSVDVINEDDSVDTYYYDVTSNDSANIVIEATDEKGELVQEIIEVGSANDYLNDYGNNLQFDKDSQEHVDTATKTVRSNVKNYGTIWSLVPPIIAILLALITKEVYSSLFVGILFGGLIYSNFSFEGTMTHTLQDGFVASISDSYNIGIIIFLVLLGALVAMMNKAGGSRAFGRWTAKHIKSRVGAQLATILLGVLIFIDDYFNCLTVGSVMRPVADKHKLSRAKLSYLIDATAAPICIIAPISSWAAAVAGFAKGAGATSGMSLFVSAIPYNFYAILTIIMMVFLAITKFDFGPMKKHENNAINGDIFTTGEEEMVEEEVADNPRGKVIDLVVPVIVLIIFCVLGMIYSGGFFATGDDKNGFIKAFSESDASVGLVIGSFAAIIFTVIFYLCRRVLKFKECMDSIPQGFKAMVPAILILCCAWTLKTMTDSLGAKMFISRLVEGSAGAFALLLPAIIFIIAVGLSFATGTSWGTFGILIPIVLSLGLADGEMTIISISACMAGAVCGDHCSPISDTTIMASAGAQCKHINHVSTQLPYALTVAGVTFVAYIIAALVKSWLIALPIAIVLMIGTLFVIKLITKNKVSK